MRLRCLPPLLLLALSPLAWGQTAASPAPAPAPAAPVEGNPTPVPTPSVPTTGEGAAEAGEGNEPRARGELNELLREIDREATALLPLFGQAQFRQAMDALASVAPDRRPSNTPPPSYQIAPGDRFNITFGNAFVPSLTVDVTVRPNGTINFEPAGTLSVAGLTLAQFEQRVTEAIRLRGPRNATVQVVFTQLHTLRVAVNGQVRRASPTILLEGYARLFEALAAAGGPDSYASLRHVRIYRDGKTIELDLYRTLLHGDPSADFALRDRDAVFVPVASRLVGVRGEVRRPARYELTTETTLRQVLQMAGGFLPKAARLQVVRVGDNAREAITDLDARAVLAGTADVSAVEPLRDGDMIEVQPVGNQRDVIQVRGAVGREDVFGFVAGMTLGDALNLAGGVLREGHVPVGVIRRLQPNGEISSINFEVADAGQGGAAARIPLQPGDTVEIGRSQDRPLLTLEVVGLVNSPGTYSSRVVYTLSDLIREAKGLAPGAALGAATLYSTASGTQEQTPIDLTDVPRGGEPRPNPTLRNGDRLVVPALQVAQVRIDGFVRSPGNLLLTEGMRVADALRRAGGLLPRAATRGKLTRAVRGTRETDVIYLDWDAALRDVPEHNLLLQEGDLLQVESAASVLAPTEPVVYINGRVSRPGGFTRHRGMSVADLLREAGGLLTDADQQLAYLVRQAGEGKRQRYPINPARAMAGDAQSNLVLQDQDTVEILAAGLNQPDSRVRASGAVQRPGSQVMTLAMTVEDLLVLAGGPTPEAYLPRAHLYRRLPNGQRTLIVLDLRSRPLQIPLQDSDELQVFTIGEQDGSERTVEVKGDVQRPGVYERTAGLTLRDVLFLAGQPLHGDPSLMRIEVARARGTEVITLQPDLTRLLAGEASQNPELVDGDTVFVRTVGDYVHTAPEVLITGQVNLPGSYPLASGNNSLRELLQRAGGLQADAFLEGAALLRRVDEEIHPEIAVYTNVILENLRVKRQRADFALLISKGGGALLEKLPSGERFVPTEAVQSSLSQLLPQPADDVQTGDIAASTSAGGTGPDTSTMRRYVRVAVDIEEVAAGRASDILLRPNDIVIVPVMPQTVLVEGEVLGDRLQRFVPGQVMDYYIRRCGGFTDYADRQQALVLRADGAVDRAHATTRIRRGDIIVVPPKGLALPREKSRFEDLQALTSVLGGLAATLLAVSRVGN